MPRFEHVLNSLSFDQCACKYRAKFFRAIAWLEALHVDSAREIKELFLRKTAYAKRVGSSAGQHQQKISELVFSHKPLTLEQQPVFPPLNRRHIPCRCCLVGLVDLLLATVAMPSRDLNNGGDATLFRYL